jgi:biuret amidohydrolase
MNGTKNMSREIVGRIKYEYDVDATVLLSVDFQLGFGESSWEPVPGAAAAVDNFRAAAVAWRAAGGTVVHLVMRFTHDRKPTGRLTDFVPDVADALAVNEPMAASYPDVIERDELVIAKTSFSGVLSSDLVDQLRARGFDSVVIGGLTTPICVQATADGLSMSGFKVTVLSDACAAEAIGGLSAAEAHDAAIERLAYVFAAVATTADFVAEVELGDFKGSLVK